MELYLIILKCHFILRDPTVFICLVLYITLLNIALHLVVRVYYWRPLQTSTSNNWFVLDSVGGRLSV